MSNKFKAGDFVECIEDGYNYIKKGDVVTIDKVWDSGWLSFAHLAHKYKPSSFNIVRTKETKWHPHHDLIINWLSSEDMMVDIKVRGEWKPVFSPDWHPESQYRVYHKDTTPEQLEIEDVKHQLEQLQDRLNELEAVYGK